MTNVRYYSPRTGESMSDIALQELGDERRWLEIKDLNRQAYPHMGYGSYFPVGAVIMLPDNTGVPVPMQGSSTTGKRVSL